MRNDIKKNFLAYLDHGGKLYEVMNREGYVYYIIEDHKGEEWLSTRLSVNEMVQNWNHNYGFTKGESS